MADALRVTAKADKGRAAKRERAGDGAVLLQSAWAEIKKEPGKLAAIAYVWLTAVGFAHLFGSGMAFGLNVIDLASPSDFLLAGVRDPFVTLLAAVTGWWLFSMWMKALRHSRPPRALLPIALGLLVLGAFCSGAYRRNVVTGVLKDVSLLAPKDLTVTLDGGNELPGVRLAVATADFLILGAADGKTIILPKGSLKQAVLTVP